MDVLWAWMALGCSWDYEGEVSLEPKGDALPSLGPPSPDAGSVTCRVYSRLPRRAEGGPGVTLSHSAPGASTLYDALAHAVMGPCDFCPTLSMSHGHCARSWAPCSDFFPPHMPMAVDSPQRPLILVASLSPSPAGPSARELPWSSPAWPLAGISPAVAALCPLEQLQEEELVGMALQALLRPPPLCVQPGPSCFAMPGLGQQDLSRPSAALRAPRRGAGEETGIGVGEGQARRADGITQLHRRSGPAPACSGGGASSRLQTHTLCAQIIHGHLEELPPASSNL